MSNATACSTMIQSKTYAKLLVGIKRHLRTMWTWLNHIQRYYDILLQIN